MLLRGQPGERPLDCCLNPLPLSRWQHVGGSVIGRPLGDRPRLVCNDAVNRKDVLLSTNGATRNKTRQPGKWNAKQNVPVHGIANFPAKVHSSSHNC
jgi:hypothetical protein